MNLKDNMNTFVDNSLLLGGGKGRGGVRGWLGKGQQGAARLPEGVDYLFSMDHTAMLRCAF